MTKKIHILYTIPNFDTAGSGKVVFDLARKLDSERFRVSIACNHNKGTFFKEVESLGIPIHLIQIKVPIRPYYNLVWRVKPFKDFIKKHKVDIVHSWDWSSDWSEALACRLAGIKFVYTKKAMGWGNIHWKIRSYLSDFIITVNTDMRLFFPFKKQQKLIPFGLDTAHYNPDLFSVNKPIEVFKIITVANLAPVKGIEVLLSALKLVNPSILLDIVGDTRDSYTDTLKQMVVDLQLQHRVTFLGKKPDVRQLLRNSDLYVIPSKKEGMPMALVEAMCMEIPVLGSDISGIRYVLKEFEDLLFPCMDSEALANKIDRIYNQTPEDRNSLGKALREYCLSNFNMNKFITSHELLYQELKNAT
ncbi:glycosyltransferase [Xanthomarina gelatinilytica]|uniref:glycosyltransferase n=1 Tax=Xanthomarina gelatinilytica TaxID=1137281 RepID=UPI003AA8E21E